MDRQRAAVLAGGQSRVVIDGIDLGDHGGGARTMRRLPIGSGVRVRTFGEVASEVLGGETRKGEFGQLAGSSGIDL